MVLFVCVRFIAVQPSLSYITLLLTYLLLTYLLACVLTDVLLTLLPLLATITVTPLFHIPASKPRPSNN